MRTVAASLLDGTKRLTSSAGRSRSLCNAVRLLALREVRMYKRLSGCAAVLIGLNVGGAFTGLAEAGSSMQTSNGQPAYILKITGSDAEVAYSGECWVRASDRSERRVPVGGTVPHSQELPGHGLRCDIVQESAAGSLTVEIVSKNGGNRSRSRTQGAGSRVRIQMR